MPVQNLNRNQVKVTAEAIANPPTGGHQTSLLLG